MTLLSRTIITVFTLLFCVPSAAGARADRIGTTFSPVQREYLEMSGEEVLGSVLEMGFDIIRLGAYWSRIEKKEGVFDFSELDRQIDLAERKKVPVILTVGMKAPRWPEYFIPAWLERKADLPYGRDVSEDSLLRKKTLEFVTRVVKRYREREIIKVWQVENEPLNRFGGRSWYIGRDFLEREVDLVRILDGGRRKILLTAATYPNTLLRILARASVKHDAIEECLELCDIIGYNIYPTVGHRLWWFDLYWKTTEPGREKYFTALYEKSLDAGKEPWIVELQAEPWEPGHLVYKKKGHPPSCDPGKAVKAVSEFENIGFDTILLWGAEYWLYCLQAHGDGSWTDAVSGVLEREKVSGERKRRSRYGP
ncbi:MAG: hypothetical protein GF408_06905 [Candidatus Omnitrophica bacterium]|nr:hypothetical protein [Candidatus Omnitrophota bacterium]